MGNIRPLWLRPFLLIGLVLVKAGLCAQVVDGFDQLSPRGPVPKDFILSSQEKHDIAMEHLLPLEGDEAMEGKETKSLFFEESAYYLNQLLLSGKVMYNDDLSIYLKEVGNYLLRGHPELRSQLRFYAVKSPTPNAFATNDGLVLFNVGLMAKLENEAQLAYILAHEISHYVKKHPLDIFLNSHQQEEAIGTNELENDLLDQNNYTREKEQEADIMGLEIYLNTDYDLDAVLSTFDVLKYSHLHFDNEPFDQNFFETRYLKFPNTYFLENVVSISDKYSNFDEQRSTHPSPDARKTLMQAKVDKLDKSGKKEYVFGQKKFSEIREKCRLESAHLLLLQQRYEAAIYHSYLLLQDHPDNFYLEKVIAQSLYALSSYADEGKFWDVHIDFDDIEGYPQQLHYLIEKLEDDELNMMALLYNWDLYRKHPYDPELNRMVDDLMISLAKNYVDDISYFSPKPYYNTASSTDSEQPKLITKYALVDYLQDPRFSSRFKAQFEAARKLKEEEVVKLREGKEAEAKKKQKQALKGFNLGLDRVVFVDPYYKRIDQREESSVQFFESESAQEQFIDRLKTHGNSIGLETEVLSARQLGEDDTEVFKDLSILNRWITEKSNYEDLDLVNVTHDDVQYLIEKYNTRYFIWAGAVSLTSRKPNKVLTLLAGVVLLPTLPYAIYSAATPRHDTFLYLMVYDLETAKPMILYPKYLNMQDKRDVFDSVIYDLLLQIKSP